jgi:TetR/AcrR family fatty acid metabolism transcriptional regulator
MSKRDEILEVAMKIFAKNGYQESTIAQIAEGVGISDASIYQHFKNKEDLLFKIPEEKMEEVINMIKLHLQGIKGALNKIRKYVWFYLWFYETNKDWVSIVMLELKTNKNFMNTPGYELVKQYTGIIIKIIEEGKAEGCIRTNVNPYIFRYMLLGTLEHMTIRWLMYGNPESLVTYSDEATDLLIKAVV